MNERELLARKAQLVAQARGMLEKIEAEKRDFSAEEQTNYEAIFTDIGKLDKKISNLRMLGTVDEPSELLGTPERPEAHSGANPDEERRARGWSAYLRRAPMNAPELRGLQADSDADGGYLSAPEQFVNNLIQAVDNIVYLRGWSTRNTVTSAQSLGMPYLASDIDDADWTSELAIGKEDTGLSFGKRELWPHPLAKLVKISNKLLRLTPNVDALAIARMAYKFGVTLEKAYMVGTGSGQPLGVFIATDDGIPTSRDVSTGNTATSIQTDGLIEAKYTLKAAYWPRAKWLFHRDAVKQLAKLQDDDGHYLWQPSITMGQPDQLFGVPLFASEYVPNTFTTGQYVGILGDFSYYYTADALEMSVQRLLELYAAANQTGFIARLETDGMPVLGEAFARVKLA